MIPASSQAKTSGSEWSYGGRTRAIDTLSLRVRSERRPRGRAKKNLWFGRFASAFGMRTFRFVNSHLKTSRERNDRRIDTRRRIDMRRRHVVSTRGRCRW